MKFGAYNLDDFSFRIFKTIDNIYQYSFKEDPRFFTNGHSIENGFEVGYTDGKTIKTIMALKDQEKSCIFPLCIGKGEQYYLLYENEKTENETRSIIKLINDKIEYIVKSKKTIYGAAIIDNILYYTAFNYKNEVYDVYSFDLETKEEKLMKTGLTRGEVFKYNNELYFQDGVKIYNDKKSYVYGDYNYFDEENDLLLQIIVDENHDLVFRVTDLLTNDVIGEVYEPINYKIDRGSIIVYSKKGIKKVDLNQE